MADIEIKRGYEVLPDNRVRFGIRVINNGNSAISEVEVILDYSHSLFELEGSRIEELGTIPPSIPRTAKFILKPLGCVHKEEIGATIRYRDHKWEKCTFEIRPKEIHCVCPFLKEKTITRKDFLKLFNGGFPAERGLNFENIQLEKVAEFITHTCKNRLYKVDEFSIENGKILYLAGDSVGEKAYYLLTAVVMEREGIVQVLLQAKSDKEFGINGFLNEIVENLRHLVQSLSAAKEIGIIKNEQVINIIDSVVQHTNFSGGTGSSSVNIQDSVVQRTNFESSEDEFRKRMAEEKLLREQEEAERKAREEELERRKLEEAVKAQVSEQTVPDPAQQKAPLRKPGSYSRKGTFVFSLVFGALLIGVVSLFVLNGDSTVETNSASSVFGQESHKTAPQANIDIVVLNNSAVKLEHLGGDTIFLSDHTSTAIMLARADGTSASLNTNGCPSAFDVGSTCVLSLREGTSSTTFSMADGEFATIKIVDIKTKQLIADKGLRF